MRDFDEALPGMFRVGYQVAFRMTGSHADAEDIAQEIGARALVRWGKVEPYAEAWAARSAAAPAGGPWRPRGDDLHPGCCWVGACHQRWRGRQPASPSDRPGTAPPCRLPLTR